MSMGIVNELQASAETDDVLTLLRKAKRVASKLNREDITLWLDNEQNGYKNGADVPDYRRISSEFAYDTNGYIPVGYGLLKSGVNRIGKMGMNVTGRAKTSQRGALKTGQYCDASYTSSVPFHASFV